MELNNGKEFSQLAGSDRFFEVHQMNDGGYAMAGNVIPGYYVNVDDLLVWKS